MFLASFEHFMYTNLLILTTTVSFYRWQNGGIEGLSSLHTAGKWQSLDSNRLSLESALVAQTNFTHEEHRWKRYQEEKTLNK